MNFNREKFKSLVLYILWKTRHVNVFGKTKLDKTLWFSEARAFEAYGAPITGEEFVRDKYGPRSRHLQSACIELADEGLLEPFTEAVGDHNAIRYRAMSPPDTSMFTGEQLSIIDWWVSNISENHTATSISELPHDYGWEVAGMGESLPLQAFLARRIRGPKTDDERDWAKKEAECLGLK